MLSDSVVEGGNYLAWNENCCRILTLLFCFENFWYQVENFHRNVTYTLAQCEEIYNSPIFILQLNNSTKPQLRNVRFLNSI